MAETLFPPSSGEGAEADFASALRQLMAREEFDRISVSAIAERAGYSRKTFYAHFKSKDQLLRWMFYREFAAANESALAGGGWKALRAFAEFFATDRAFFANALRSTRADSFSRYFSELLYAAIYVSTVDVFERWVEYGKAVDLCVENLTESALRIFRFWLEDPDEPPVDVLMTFLECSLLALGEVARER